MPIEDSSFNFEIISEIDREQKPKPADLLLEPEKYMIRRLATPEEREDLVNFTRFLNDPRGGKKLDSDVLRAQAADYDPVVRYLEWLGYEEGDEEAVDMAMDRIFEITHDERAPLNLMGHVLEIDRNYKERMNLFRVLPGLLKRMNALVRKNPDQIFFSKEDLETDSDSPDIGKA